MQQVFFLIRFLLLAVSAYGSLRFLRKYLPAEFCFGVYFSVIGSVLFLAGILNFLREAAWCLFLAGLLLAGLSVRQKLSPAGLCCWGTAFFLAFGSLLFFLLRGSIFVEYDDFSHWALASRILTRYDRFPNFQDTYVLFTSYPVGSAAFVYYVTEILGASAEWLQMYAQGMLMAGMAVSLFAFARNAVQALAAALCAVVLLCGCIPFTSLLVDTLLPLVGLSAAAFFLYCGKKPGKNIWVFIPYSIFLLSIKNSGAFFAAIVFVLLFLTCRRAYSLKIWAALACMPVAVLLLWQKHVRQVFANGLMGKHSMSPFYFYAMLQRKGLGEIGQEIQSVLTQMAEKTVSLSNHALWVLAWGLLLWLVLRHCRRADADKAGRTLLLAAASYLFYQLGTLGMYLFSMPASEAMRLAGYERYHQSIVLFLTGLVLLETLQALDALRLPTRWEPMPLLAALAVCLFTVAPSFSFFKKQQYQTSERYHYDTLIEAYQIPQEAGYLILVREERQDYGFLDHLTQYLLNPKDYRIVKDCDLSGVDCSDVNYVIAFEQSEKIEEFLAALSPDAAPVVCLREPAEEY